MNYLESLILLIFCVLLVSCTNHEDKSLDLQDNAIVQMQGVSPPVSGSIVLKLIEGSQEELILEDNPLAFVQGEEIHLLLHGNKREDGRIFILNKRKELVKMLYAGKIKEGDNEFSFQYEPLLIGCYDLYVTLDVYEDTILHVGFDKINI